MFGFSALSEAPFSSDVEAQASLPVLSFPVGAIGASALGVYAIGRATDTTDAYDLQYVENGYWEVGYAEGDATAGVSQTASASASEVSVQVPVAVVTVGAISQAQAETVSLTPAESSATGAAEAVFDDLIEVGVNSPEPTTSAVTSATAQPPQITLSPPESTETGTAVAEATIPAISVFTPTARVDGIEVPDALGSITVSAPTANAGVPANGAGALTTVSIASPNGIGLLETIEVRGTVTIVTVTNPNGSILTLSLPDNASYNRNRSWILTETNQILQYHWSDGNVDTGLLELHSYDLSGNTSLLDSLNLIIGSLDAFDQENNCVIDFDDLATCRVRVSIQQSKRVYEYINIAVVGNAFANPYTGDTTNLVSAPNLFEDEVNSSSSAAYYYGAKSYQGILQDPYGYVDDALGLENSSRKWKIIRFYGNGSHKVGAIDYNSQTSQGTLNRYILLRTADAAFADSFYNSFVSDAPNTILYDANRQEEAEASFLDQVNATQTDIRFPSVAQEVQAEGFEIPVEPPATSFPATSTASIPSIAVSAPVAVATGEAFVFATATLPSITVGAPLTTETVVEIPIANPPITVSAPAATLAVTSTASAQLVVVTTTAPQATLSASSTAAATLVTITVSPAQSETTLDVLVEATLPAVSITAPETIEVVIEQVAIPQVTLTPAEATLSGSAVATYALVLIDASAPQATPTAAGNVDTAVVTVSVGVPGVNAVGTSGGTASASLPTVTVSTPEPTVLVSSSALPTIPQVTVVSPDADAVLDSLTEVIAGSTTLTATPQLVQEAAASSAGTASVFGSATAVALISGATQGTSQVAAAPTAVLEGATDQVDGTSVVSGSADRLKDVQGSAQGSTTLSSSCTIVKNATSSVATASAVSGTAEFTTNLQGSLATASTVSGILGQTRGVSGTIAGSATVSAIAFVTTPLIAGDVSELRTVTIAEDTPRVAIVQSDTIRYVAVFPDRSRTVRIIG